MGSLYRIVDSRFVSRVGSVGTLVKILGLGAALVAAVVLAGAGVLRVAGWIPILCFGVWAALSVLLAASWALRRPENTLLSSFERLTIEQNLPGSTRVLIAALANAEHDGRRFIAETALLVPINNSRSALELARAYALQEAEVAALVEHAEELDERWSLLWSYRPSWARHVSETPYTRADLDDLGRYMALQTRRLSYIIRFLQTGDDQPVRHIRTMVKAQAEKERSEPAQ